MLSVGGLLWLVASAETAGALVAAWIFGLANVLLFTTSSTYHVWSRSPRARRIMRRLDHSMIYVLIAGTFTPICILAMTGAWRWVVLGAVWAGAVTGMVLTLTALDRFHRITFAMYLVLGWAGLLALPALLDEPANFVLALVAGVLYTVGAVLFSLKKPTLSPAWFGYHELWHVFGVAAAGLFFALNLGLITAAGAG